LYEDLKFGVARILLFLPLLNKGTLYYVRAYRTYWSSTEDEKDYAWYQGFYIGNQSTAKKIIDFGGTCVCVRCVRDF